MPKMLVEGGTIKPQFLVIARVTAVLAVAGVLTLTGPTRADAAEFKTGADIVVEQGEVIDDDLFAAGNSVTIRGTVNGDVFAAGNVVSISGKVNGNVHAAASTVTISGSVSNSARIAGSRLAVSGQIGRDLFAAGANVNLEISGTVNGDVYAAGADLALDGDIGRNLVAGGATVRINGSVGGDATIEAETVRVGPDGAIAGDLTYTSDKEAETAAGGEVAGTVTRMERPARVEFEDAWIGWELLGRFIVFVMGLATGALVIVIAPQLTASVERAIRQRVGWSLLSGAIAFVAVPVAIGMLLVSIVGIPIAIMTAVLWLIAMYLAPLPASLAIGRLLVVHWRDGDSRPQQLGAFSIGLILISIVTAIPWLGFVVTVAILLLGVGAIGKVIVRSFSSPAPQST